MDPSDTSIIIFSRLTSGFWKFTRCFSSATYMFLMSVATEDFAMAI